MGEFRGLTMVISKIASALPETTISNDVIAEICGSDKAFLEDKVGIISRHFLAPNEKAMDLALNACCKLVTKHNRDGIGLCIWVGQVKDQKIPHSSAMLQARLELPTSSICFDLGLACSGYVHALIVADAMMRAYHIENALVVTCDPYSLIMDKKDRNTAPLFGDAATATLLASSGNGIEIGKCDLGTDGRGANYLECAPDSGGHLYMDGKGIFNFAMRRVPQSIAKCLRLNNANMEGIDYFVLHQANAFILANLCAAMRIDKNKCPVMMQYVANTVSSSIPLVLENIELAPGNQIILCGFGAGLSWGTVYGRFIGNSPEKR